MIIGLIDVCARRLNVVAMLPVTSYKTCLCHYSLHHWSPRRNERSAAEESRLYVRRVPNCQGKPATTLRIPTRVEGKTYISEWRTLSPANAWDVRGSL